MKNLLVFLLIGMTILSYTYAENAEEYFNRGMAFYKAGKLNQAIAYNGLGLAYQGKGQFDKADAAFRKAVELENAQ